MRVSVLLFFALILLTAAPAQAGNPAEADAPAQAGTLKVRADTWCPCNCDPATDRKGYAVETVEKILGEAGHKIDYRLTNWSRSIARARTGEFDAILCAARTDAPDFIFPKEPVGIYQTAFLTRKDDPFSYHDVSSLDGRMLGVIKSYAYDDDIDAYIRMHGNDPHRIIFASGDDALAHNIDRLLDQRIDTLVDDANVLEYKINALRISDRVSVHRTAATVPVYLAFSPSNPKSEKYAEEFDKGMQRLRESGAYAEIMKRYGLSDWKK